MGWKLDIVTGIEMNQGERGTPQTPDGRTPWTRPAHTTVSLICRVRAQRRAGGPRLSHCHPQIPRNGRRSIFPGSENRGPESAVCHLTGLILALAHFLDRLKKTASQGARLWFPVVLLCRNLLCVDIKNRSAPDPKFFWCRIPPATRIDAEAVV